MSVYRTIGPLVVFAVQKAGFLITGSYHTGQPHYKAYFEVHRKC